MSVTLEDEVRVIEVTTVVDPLVVAISRAPDNDIDVIEATTSLIVDMVYPDWLQPIMVSVSTKEQGEQGAQGPQGPQGATGLPGPAGPPGRPGADSTVPGPIGPEGPVGPKGPQGATGAQGPQGNQGVPGADSTVPGPEGSTGAQGPQGVQGVQGVPGTPGADGAAGPKGDQGDPGVQGPVGPSGATGAPGATGATGAQGPEGATGPAGVDGATGPAGAQGPPGTDGAAGPPGPQGPIGETGAAGTGINIKGQVPTVGDLPPTGNADGDAYVVVDTGDLWIWDSETGTYINAGPIQGPKGDAGPQGPVGAQGPKGDIGAQGPVGPTGTTGATGAQGPKGDQGTTGATGPIGPAGADSTVPGPVGPTGATGAAGATGPAGAVGAQGPQGVQGVQGVPGMPGADSTVPGPPGPTGPSGATGAQGPTGTPGATGAQGPQGVPGADSTVPGPAGPQGPQGIPGNTGATGAQGPQGNTGATGPAGPTAISADAGNFVRLGSDGLTFAPQALLLTGGTLSGDLGVTGGSWLNGGIHFSTVNPSDPSSIVGGIEFYSGYGGFGVTPGTLNYNWAGVHQFLQGATPIMQINGGLTMQSPLWLFRNPVDTNEAATKNYVDNRAPLGGPYLPLAGGTVTGPLTIGAGTNNALTITPGATATGPITITSGPTGPLTLATGNSPTGNAGTISLLTGTPTSGIGGGITLQTASTASLVGTINLVAGNTSAALPGGTIQLTAGNTTGGGASAGAIALTTGSATTTGNGSGGNLTLKLGSGIGTGVGGALLISGTGSTNNLTIRPGAAASQITLAASGASGIKFTSVVTLALDPVASLDAATKAYVDAQVALPSGVTSFNTRAGDVVLSNADVIAVLPSSSTLPIMDGAAAIGAGTTWARADHIHPTDTTRYAASNPAGYVTAAGAASVAPVQSVAGRTGAVTLTHTDITDWTATLAPYALTASPVFTGDPQAPTPATADSDTSIATTAFVKNQGYATTAGVAGAYLPLSGGVVDHLGITNALAVSGTSVFNLAATFNNKLSCWGLLAFGGNNQSVPPVINGGYSQWNYSGGAGEVNVINGFSSASLSFSWLQVTSPSTIKLLASLDTAGVISTSGAVFSGPVRSGYPSTITSTNTTFGFKNLNSNASFGIFMNDDQTFGIGPTDANGYATNFWLRVTSPGDIYPSGTIRLGTVNDDPSSVNGGIDFYPGYGGIGVTGATINYNWLGVHQFLQGTTPIMYINGGLIMQTPLTLAHDPSASNEAATKNYVDQKVGGISGGTVFVGTINGSNGNCAFTTASGHPNGPLPAASTAPNQYVICNVAGTPPSGPMSGVPLAVQDWVISDGTQWTHLAFSTGAILASGVQVSPAVGGATDVQTALTNNYARSGVSSFNTRTGAIVLSNADVVAVLPGSASVPLVDGTAVVGTAATWARADHVHPTDTSRYAASNPAGYVTAAGASAAAPVQSVAGKTGAVTLVHTDITDWAATLAPYALTANVPIAASSTPIMDGTATVGTSTTWARADHVHPTDTTRYAASNPAGYVTAAGASTAAPVQSVAGRTGTVTLTHGDITDWAATLAPYALTANVPVASSALPLTDGIATVGTGTTWARADHIHPTDTTRYAASNPAGYVTAAGLAPYALLASPVFTGDPQAPTPTTGDNDNSIATTAFVTTATGSYLPLAGGVLNTPGNLDIFGRFNAYGLFFTGLNTQTVPPPGGGGMFTSWNFSGGGGENVFWNGQAGGDPGFDWRLITGSGTSNRLMFLNSTGALSLSGSLTVNAATQLTGSLTAVSHATFQGGISFNNYVGSLGAVAAIAGGIDMFGGSYGFSITGGTLNVIAGGTTIAFLPSGGVVTASLTSSGLGFASGATATLGRDPSAALEAVTKQYVDSTIVVSDTAPVGARDNTFWFDSSGTGLYIRFNDGTSTQWVLVAGGPAH